MKHTPYSDAEQFIIDHASLTHKILRKADSALSIHGISFTEYLVLHNLNESPNATMRRIDLASAIGVTASAVTRILAPMEKIHLIDKEKNPRDARVSLVKLSPTGSQLYTDARTSFAYSADALTQRLDQGQLSQIRAITQTLITN